MVLKKLGKQIRYDFVAGFASTWKMYLVFLVFLIVQLMIVYRERILGSFASFHSWADYITFFFLGTEKTGVLDRTRGIRIPFEWFFLQFFVLLPIIKYPRQDCEESGYQVLMRIGSKKIWWISKNIWCMMQVLLYYMIF